MDNQVACYQPPLGEYRTLDKPLTIGDLLALCMSSNTGVESLVMLNDYTCLMFRIVASDGPNTLELFTHTTRPPVMPNAA